MQVNPSQLILYIDCIDELKLARKLQQKNLVYGLVCSPLLPVALFSFNRMKVVREIATIKDSGTEPKIDDGYIFRLIKSSSSHCQSYTTIQQWDEQQVL